MHVPTRRPRSRPWRLSIAGLAVRRRCAAGGAPISRPAPTPSRQRDPGCRDHPQPLGHATARPNIVFVLTDDLSWTCCAYMPHVPAMQRHGPHVQRLLRLRLAVLPVALLDLHRQLPARHRRVQQHRCRTAASRCSTTRRGAAHVRGRAPRRRLPHRDDGQVPERLPTRAAGTARRGVPPTYVPPGWIDVGRRRATATPSSTTSLNENGTLQSLRPPAVGLPDRRARAQGRRLHQPRRPRPAQPFFLELATFAPHRPVHARARATPNFPGLTRAAARRTSTAAHERRRSWLGGHPPLEPRADRPDQPGLPPARPGRAGGRRHDRPRSSRRSRPTGIANNTYLVFSSDNGLHTGEYRLMPGKLTAFDTDIHVPLVVDRSRACPPGAQHERDGREHRPAKTFAADRRHQHAAATATACVPLSRGDEPADWRNAS